mgnify:CR=1 FL=1
MTEEVKRGWVLKFSIIIIVATIVALIVEFTSKDPTPIQEDIGYYDHFDKL